MHRSLDWEASDVINCWEYKKCGREPGGSNCAERGVCPAAIDSTYEGMNHGKKGGRICWAVAGTLCSGEVQGLFAMKIDSCMKCDFFKLVAEEEDLDLLISPPEKLSTEQTKTDTANSPETINK